MSPFCPQLSPVSASLMPSHLKSPFGVASSMRTFLSAQEKRANPPPDKSVNTFRPFRLPSFYSPILIFTFTSFLDREPLEGRAQLSSLLGPCDYVRHTAGAQCLWDCQDTGPRAAAAVAVPSPLEPPSLAFQVSSGRCSWKSIDLGRGS